MADIIIWVYKTFMMGYPGIWTVKLQAVWRVSLQKPYSIKGKGVKFVISTKPEGIRDYYGINHVRPIKPSSEIKWQIM